MVMRKIQRAGGSYYVTLPKAYICKLGMLQGRYVNVAVEKKKRIVITALKIAS